jgi:hypothetical protein
MGGPVDLTALLAVTYHFHGSALRRHMYKQCASVLHSQCLISNLIAFVVLMSKFQPYGLLGTEVQHPNSRSFCVTIVQCPVR